jgi:uncharacterized protein
MDLMKTSGAPEADAFARPLQRLGFTLTSEQLQRIRERLSEIRGYVPKVGIFGKTGAGKSSLCNALFGQDVFEVDGVEACTRALQQVELRSASGDGGILLVDVPGVGEDQTKTEEYGALYTQLLPTLDLVIWVLKADDRALEIDKQVYEQRVIRQAGSIPIVFVLNQVDKLDPIRDWDRQGAKPGNQQLETIERKRQQVKREFGIPLDRICAVSAEERYGLVTLVDAIVRVVPNEKKASFFREAREETRSSQSAQEVEKGIWETIKEFVVDGAKKVGDFYETNKATVHVVVAALWKVFLDMRKSKR